MSIRVIFWGNSQSVFSGRHFQALLAVPCELAAVVDVPAAKQGSTNPLPAGLPNFVDVVGQRNIPVFAPGSTNEPGFMEKLSALAPDLFLAVGYALILKPAVLAVPRLSAVNFHASLLPHYRGKHPVFWTLRGGERWAGLTAHIMDPGIDTGDIIYQVKVLTRRDDTVATLYERIMDRSVELVGRLVADMEQDALPRRPQPVGDDSYFSSTTQDDFSIDWGWDAEKIRRYITMTPGKCWATLAGRRIYLAQAKRAGGHIEGAHGTIVTIGRSRCTIAAGRGAVSIGRGRLEEGREQSLASLFRRLGLKAGDSWR